MRKWLGITGALLLALLVGCNSQQTNSAPMNDTALEPKDLYANNCSSCHGGNFQGSLGPGLEKVGSKLSQAEIESIIQNGKGSMPGQSQISPEARQKLAAWLAEKK